MTQALRWGILGTGWIADLIVQDLLLTGHAVSSVGSRTQAGATASRRDSASCAPMAATSACWPTRRSTSSRWRRRYAATIQGSEARIEIDATWYAPTAFHILDDEEQLMEDHVSMVRGRGMEFQADEIKHLVSIGCLAGDVLPPEEGVAIMQSLDAIRTQIGWRYPGE